MAISVSRDDVPLVENTRLLPATPVLPYVHQEVGNFVCLTEDDVLPSYDALGVTQTLAYLSAAELAALRG